MVCVFRHSLCKAINVLLPPSQPVIDTGSVVALSRLEIVSQQYIMRLEHIISSVRNIAQLIICRRRPCPVR